jgi:hypothetical protein
MSFEAFLQQKVHPLLCKDPFDHFAKSLIPYKSLRDLLKQIDPKSAIESTLIAGSGQCCICLEDFDRWSEMVFTKCNHPFHPACLAGYLESVGPCKYRTCPLCRSPEEDLHPFGQDGNILDFLLKFWVRVKAVESCHTNFMRIAQCQLRQLRRLQPSLTLLERMMGSRRKRLMREDAKALILKLDAADFIASVNRNGFLKILQEFEDRVMEAAPADFYRERLLACQFVIDSAPAGRIAEVRADAAALLGPADARHFKPGMPCAGGLGPLRAQLIPV